MRGVGGGEGVVLWKGGYSGRVVGFFTPFLLFLSLLLSFIAFFLFLFFTSSWPEWLQRWFVVGWRGLLGMDLAASSLVAYCFLSLSLCFVFVFVWPAWGEKKMRQEDMIPIALFFFGHLVLVFLGGREVEGRGVAASLLCCCCCY